MQKTPRALKDVDFFRKLPKAELHVHLDGSIRPETVVDLARSQNIDLGIGSASSLKRAVQPPADSPSLEKYLEAFEILCRVLASPEAIYRVTRELLEDLSADGVRYAEIRYSPRVLPASVASSEAIAAVGRGICDAERELPIEARQILCVMRHEPPSAGVEVAELAVKHRDDRVVALDIAGAEAGNPPAPHRDAFDLIRKAGLRSTVHAGEAGPAENIRDSIVYLGADRIGHGTRLPENEAWLEAVADQQICIEACLTSNVQTGAVGTLEEHPLLQFLSRGIPVSLATDNLTVSSVTLSEEFLTAHTTFNLSDEQLGAIALAGFEHAFLPIHEKQKLTSSMRAEVRELLT
jgi:adenosine deaminase